MWLLGIFLKKEFYSLEREPVLLAPEPFLHLFRGLLFVCFFKFWFFKTGFLCVALEPVLELTL